MNGPIHLNARVPITAAQIKLLNTTPVQIIPGAPGKIVNIYNLYLRYFFGTTPFNPVDGDSFIWFLGSTSATAIVNYPSTGDTNAVGFVDQSQDMGQWFDGWMGGVPPAIAPLSDISNSGLYLCQCNVNGDGFPPDGTSDWTQGDGSLLALVEYSLVDAA